MVNRKKSRKGFDLKTRTYKSSFLNRTLGRNWKGPVYLNSQSHKEDLQYIIGNLRSFVRANVPLAKGLEAAAVEEQRFSYRDLSTNLFMMALFMAMPFLLFFFGHHAIQKNGAREKVLIRLRDLLESGLDLSEAMRRLPRFFPKIYADMVEAGEQTGRMEECLAELSVLSAESLSTNQQVRSIFIYLGVTLLIQIFILFFLVVKVAPVFLEIYEEMGYSYTERAPFVSRLMESIDALSEFRLESLSTNVFSGGITAFVMIVFAFLLLRIFRKQRRTFFASPLLSLFLVIPGLRGLIMQSNFAVITGTLEKLLHAGVPLDVALKKTSDGDISPVYAGMLRKVHARLLEGDSLVAAFQTASSRLLVPASFTSLLAVGEQSGMLPEALAYLWTFYRNQAKIRIQVLTDTLNPLGVVILGIFVLFFAVDMFSLLVGLSEAILNSM